MTRRLIPAILDRSQAMLSESDDSVTYAMYFSLTMYTSLCCMNLYWFSLMVKGLLSFFSKPKASDEKKEPETKKEQ